MKYFFLTMSLVAVIAWLSSSQEPHSATKIHIDTMAYLASIVPYKSSTCYAAAAYIMTGNHQANYGLFPSTLVCATYVVKTASLKN